MPLLRPRRPRCAEGTEPRVEAVRPTEVVMFEGFNLKVASVAAFVAALIVYFLMYYGR